MPVISTNLAANSAVRYLNINSASQTSSLSKLASGSRITQASDDAAGLAISTKISSDVTALNQAATNASHGISVLQTADGGASNISDILQRMKALASQASSGTVTDNERVYIDAEFQQLIAEVDAISTGTRYNGQSLLDGTSAFAKGINVMVGSDAADTIKVALDKLTSQGLGLKTTAGVTANGYTGRPVVQAYPRLTLDAGTTLVNGATISFKINDVDMTLTNSSGGIWDVDDLVVEFDNILDAALGHTVSVFQPGGASTDIVFMNSSAEEDMELQLTDSSNAPLTDTQAIALGFDKAYDIGTGKIQGSAALLTLDSTLTLAVGATMAFQINGVDISITNSSGALYDIDDIRDAIAADLAAYEGEDFVVTQSGGTMTDLEIRSIAEGGQLTVTNADGTAMSTAQATALLMQDGFLQYSAVSNGVYGHWVDSGAEIMMGTSVTVTEDMTFDINGFSIALSPTGGTGGKGVYTAQELVDTINQQLADAGRSDLMAYVRAGRAAVTTTAKGDETKLVIDNFSVGSAIDTLGVVETGHARVSYLDEGNGAIQTQSVLSASKQDKAVAALDVLDTAISSVSKARANIGSLESRFGFHQASIATSVENLTAAVSAIRDTDVAMEAAKLASSKVKTQAAVAAAAQASQMPQDLLKLLQ